MQALSGQSRCIDKKITQPDGIRYYSYTLLHVDDALCIHHDAKSELVKLDSYFKMKPGSTWDPDIYLSTKTIDFLVDNDVNDEPIRTWGLSPTKYVTASIKNVEDYLAK